MKRYLPKNAEDASALILTLLVIVLLSAIVTSFLSSTRTEQTATRNYSAKIRAEMFATTATQLAMAKIQLGFNATNATSGSSSANHTQIVTTQPGLIAKYFFLNGTCTGNATTALYTENGTTTSNATAYLNNLESPSSSANATSSQWTITGNASERINVYMENVTTTVNGTNQTVGRIAYYVDDELTKINMNAATSDRTTLNVSTPRSNSLSGLTSNNSTLTVNSLQITLFQNVIDGNGGGSSNISNWSHFFRNEQLSANTTFNATAAQLAQISTAPLSDFHLKYTPWGTRRLHINDEPLNATGVDNVYEALAGLNATTGNRSASPNQYEMNGWALRNIYGQTFNDKYGQNWSWTGNMSLSANTTVNGLKQTIANMLQMRAPGHHDKTTVEAGYTGAAISENGTAAFPPSGYYGHVPSGVLNEFAIKIDYNTTTKQMYIKPFIEISCPFAEGYGAGTVHIEVTIQSITYTAGNASYTGGPYKLTGNVNLSAYTGDSNHPFHKCTFNSKRFNATVPLGPLLRQTVGVPSEIIGNPTVTMGDVKLYAGTSASSVALRDWLEGSFINEKLGNGSFLTVNTPFNVTSATAADNYRANFNSSNESLQRIDPRIKGKTAWVKAPNTFSIDSGSIVNKGRGAQSWDLKGGHNTRDLGYGLKPLESATSDIPGDPSS